MPIAPPIFFKSDCKPLAFVICEFESVATESDTKGIIAKPIPKPKMKFGIAIFILEICRFKNPNSKPAVPIRANPTTAKILLSIFVDKTPKSTIDASAPTPLGIIVKPLKNAV